MRRKKEKLNQGKDIFFWNNYAKIYPELEQATPYKHLVKTIEKFVNPEEGHVWLDAGCGPGSTLDIILKNGKVQDVVGFDFNDVMLGHAQKKYENHIHSKKIKIHHHDLRKKLDYPDNNFDGIISNLVFPYITEHQKETASPLESVLKEMYRVLKPGGHLVWTTPKNKVNFFWVFIASWKEILNPRKPRNIIYGPAILRYALQIQKRGKKGIYTFWTKDKIMKVMKEIGFEMVEIEDTFARQAHVVRGIKK